MKNNLSVISVVEDEPDMRLLIEATLRQDSRIEVRGRASSAEEAAELARTVRPGLIILDHSIEGEVMGLQAAPMLKKIAPDCKILLFSAFDLAEEAEKEPAVDDFLSKSELRKLLPAVQALLGLDKAA